ncbi:hypothetical protein DXG01_012755 [Tephrocybe rancida]|nr:hypothetical protein DXG01_012755 [Tephrocybe rancida]
MHGPTTHIFLTGATGYIGGSVLARLLSHKLSDTFGITILVRDAIKAKEFRALGVKAVVGSNADLALIQQLAADVDVAFSCADADDLSAAKATLAGLKERFEKIGTPPTFIHTSLDLKPCMSGVLVDDANGMHSTSDVYSDLDLKKLESLPESQPHRNVDLAIVDADNEGDTLTSSATVADSFTPNLIGYVKTYIVLPGTIYDLAAGPLVDLGLSNAHSQQIPKMVRIALQRGEAGYVGLGKNVWPHVHIKEVADLFLLIFDQVLAHKDLDHGQQGYYFAENGEYVLCDITKAAAQALYDAGKLKSPVPSGYTEEEMQQFFPNGTMYGTNSRCQADRSRAIGWHPRKGYQDLVASIQREF